MKIITYIKNNFVWFLIIGILLFLLFKSDLKTKQQVSRYQTNIEILNDSIHSYNLSNGLLVDSKRALEVYNNELKDQVFIKDDSLKLMINKFKKVKAALIIKTVVEIDTVKIPFNEPISTPFSRLFSITDASYRLSGNVSNLGVTIDKLRIPNTQRIVIGKLKKGFFKTSLEVSVSNSNPLVNIEDINSQVVTVKNPKFHISVFTGVDYRLQYTFGVGLSYSLFSF